MLEGELIERAARRCAWSARAMEGTARDLRQAANGGPSPVDELGELCGEEAQALARLSERIAGCRVSAG